ncbi:MAG: hypothetical protein IT373_32835 [Polyangiaceae bacterium]|nr:hypothetical protein [Polyangiaceae bacterium]
MLERIQRRRGALPLVHATLAMFETVEGPFVKWAGRMAERHHERPLVELVLRLVSGPFVTGAEYAGSVEPPLDGFPAWLEEVVRILLAAPAGPLLGLVSPRPTGGADAGAFEGGPLRISNWCDAAAFDRAVAAAPEGRTTIELLREAEAQMAGQLVVLPSAERSAEGWVLDCRPEDLLRALLRLEEYAAALAAGRPREECAARYTVAAGIEMSRETGDVSRKPTRRRQREFVAGRHGTQFFDMHAKPGKATRVHVWVATAVEPPRIYVGHCGRHLD